jgi:hypothetical protein
MENRAGGLNPLARSFILGLPSESETL